MLPNLALLLGIIFILVAFKTQRGRESHVSAALIWPTLWYLIVSSRPFGVWMVTFGIPVPGALGGDAEGSVIDRNFYLVLTAIGLWILARRRSDWRGLMQRNPWLTALLAFMALSILWSDYPYVSFKRYVKVLGSIIMVLVVLTEARPFEAFLTVLRRCLYIHIPMSVVCVKYFRDIGVAYSWEGSGMWQGIATSKNTLGQIAALAMVFFAWDIWNRWRKLGCRNISVIYAVMATYLLKGSPSAVSMTSVSTAALALFIFFRIQSLRGRPETLSRFVRLACAGAFGLVLLVLLHSVFVFAADSPFGYIIAKLGRDITLTDRIYIWGDVYNVAARNPLFGIGYGGFWIGRMANIPWNATMTWVLGQAHSGYVDTYLQLGWTGGVILAGLLLSTPRRLIASLGENFDFGCFRITMFIMVLFVNIMESTYLRGDHHLWFMTLVLLLAVPAPQRALEASSEDPDASPDGEQSPAYAGPASWLPESASSARI